MLCTCNNRFGTFPSNNISKLIENSWNGILGKRFLKDKNL